MLILVALIVGLGDACCREELTNLCAEEVKDEGSVFYFKLKTTKTKFPREFFVTTRNIEGLNMVEIIRKYVRSRPEKLESSRFFLAYRNGKCYKAACWYKYIRQYA